jgi:hypothetical protein
MLEKAVEVILTQSGLAGAIALLFLYIWWKAEKRSDKIIKDRDARIIELATEKDKVFELRLQDGTKFREEIGKLKDAEIARQEHQMTMYHEFERTVEDLVRLVESNSTRRGRG